MMILYTHTIVVRMHACFTMAWFFQRNKRFAGSCTPTKRYYHDQIKLLIANAPIERLLIMPTVLDIGYKITFGYFFILFYCPIVQICAYNQSRSYCGKVVLEISWRSPHRRGCLSRRSYDVGEPLDITRHPFSSTMADI